MTALEFLNTVQMSQESWYLILTAWLFVRATREGLMVLGICLIIAFIESYWK